MIDLYLSLHDHHRHGMLPLALLVCLFATTTAVMLLRQARLSRGAARRNWGLGAGVFTGFGIWATHFIALLGFDSGFAARYLIGLILASLAAAIAATTIGFLTALFVPGRRGALLAALVIGTGIAATHYLGLAALDIPVRFAWHVALALVSLPLAIAPIYPALRFALRRRGQPSAVTAGLLLGLAVILHHFTAMAALVLIPARRAVSGGAISPETLAGWIGAVAIGLFVLSIVTLLISRRSSAAIEASERQFSLLVKGIADCAIYMLDRDGRISNWNAGAERLTGYAAEEAIGLALAHLHTVEDRAAGLPSQMLAQARAEGRFSGSGWYLRRDGSRFWASTLIEAIAGDEGQDPGFAIITRDISQFKQQQDLIAETTRHLDAALSNMHQGLCVFDAGERLVLRNRRFLELWGLSEADCPIGLSLEDFIHVSNRVRFGIPATEERVRRARKMIHDSLADPRSPPTVSRFGESLYLSIANRPLPDGGWVTTFDDISEQRQSEAKITHMALHDGLTGLANRTRFNLALDGDIEAAMRAGAQVAVVAIDMDRFKEINDTHGHAAGDFVLQTIARRLTDDLREGELAARLGGDEFAAYKLFARDDELADFITRLNACLIAPVECNGQRLSLGASLGIAVYPSDGPNRETLLNNADLAMYRAKGAVGERICTYEPGMDETARQRRQLANDLRNAVDRHEFTLLYQPQRLLQTGELSGYEALLRWHHPRRGVISPNDFIPIAEETGEILTIGAWVLRQACIEAQHWPKEQKVAVNLSPVQFRQADLADTVRAILLETGLSPRRLELEITESAIIADKLRALHCLRQIKAMGVSVAIDDFGTGYSSLDTLHSFPFDKIKIDKSFLLRAENSAQARAIIRAVLALGKSLEIPVLAEGVETERQLEVLQKEGCEEAQGYYFGRPARAPSLSVSRAANS
ncbi:bifunctional diguanylate cyclase/phosphodiesterase [Novosphingobium album (ex Liu et al. 2023)]|uniref:EAL domain-containing protein n=1 Tax=Novosphingobium album (ex Liu et al. 2023) TaxID=3031130 RepID=A0ABT5WX00_9SPHN|nr:EAL domain-containing protein [Novosphingobium album (ex Liu et al. 2023)]MDE8654409.1 EAL domain-containing protein [Novosphingobium album (ex Liu et al. 2023)]